MSTSIKAKDPAVPRPSASLVIINERNEVLLVQRNPHASTYAGAHVFPGGNFDSKQDDSVQMTAIRETFEESGLLLASSSRSLDLSDEVLDEARKTIHEQKLMFPQFLSDHHLKADVESLLPFTTWVTPINVPRRFRTDFFVVFLSAPGSDSTGFSAGNKLDRLPTPDGGLEVIAARFMGLHAAIDEFRAGKISFMPPQYYIIETLSALLTGNVNTLQQREQVVTLSRGAFGRMFITPKWQPDRDADGHEILAFDGDEMRGGTGGRLHRVLVRRKGQTFFEIILKRNFDIFTGIPSEASAEHSKL